MIFQVICLPSSILDLFSQEVWYLGPVLCKFIPWLEHSIAYSSILTIVAIAVERSLAISAPLKVILLKIILTKKNWKG